MKHMLTLYYRYLQRSWGFCTKDLIVLTIVCIVFAGAAVFWAHSPTANAERLGQRQHAIEFLRVHQYDMMPEDVQKVMSEYHITEDEIKSPVSQ